jgi:PIN like domain
MQLDPFVRDYPVYVDELILALRKPTTRVYLDTSLLMWLMRLGSQAREEFCQWCKGRTQSSIRVPVWAAHELHRHVVTGTIRASVKSTVGETQRKYAEFTSLAAERADDKTCRARGYTGRSSYVGELEKSAAVLENLSQVIQPDEDAIRIAMQQVIEFVNEHLLESDLNPAVNGLSATGEFRFAHRMPPGFEDKKEENAFGDAIIWEEIVHDAQAAKTDSQSAPIDVIIVSRDRKKDWVSSAPVVLNVHGKTQSPHQETSVDVALPHPLLVHDFVKRTGGGRLYVATPAFLATALHRDARKNGQPSPVQHWLAASHRPEFLNRLLEDDKGAGKARPPPASTASAGSAVPAPTPAAPAGGDETAFPGETPASLMGIDVADEVRQLKDALPQEQATLIEGLTQRVLTGELSAFAFGRILAQVSLDEVLGWPDQIPALLEQLAPKVSGSALNGIALSILISVYFDRYGEPLRRPAVVLAAVCLAFEGSQGFEPALRYLNGFLTDADVKLPYVPGGPTRSVKYAIDAIAGGAPRVLRDVRIGQLPVLADSLSASSPRRLSSLLSRTEAEGCSGQELRALLAREYAIPLSALSIQYDQTRYTWSPDRGLVVMDTGVDGGLSTLADEENENE